MDISRLDSINEFAIYERKPDLTLLLDLEIESGFQRLEKRYADSEESHDRFEQEARDFHRKVRSGYHALAEREPTRFVVINADQSIEAVASAIWSAVKKALL
jgi:dTMP kinase